MRNPEQCGFAELLDEVRGEDVEGVERLEALGGGGAEGDQARAGLIQAVARGAGDEAGRAQGGQDRQEGARADGQGATERTE